MASSRRSPAELVQALQQRLSHGTRWLVAFSGGLDSTALLHASCALADPARVLALHVHHGLQPAADAWPAHCDAQASALGAAFECIRLQGAPAPGQSLEAWAREHRYAALAAAARRHRADAVLTAHHADDQIETMLMRLARGSGIDGLCGIEPDTVLHGVRVLRPWLEFPRAVLLGYATQHRLQWVEDPSNRDLSRTRNALRHDLLPALDAADPGLRERLWQALPALRLARADQQAQAWRDLEAVRTEAHGCIGATADDPPALNRRVLRTLVPERCNAVLRLWLRKAGLAMPSRARLAQMRLQLVEAPGAHGRVAHQDKMLVRDRDQICLLEAAQLAAVPVAGMSLRWSGQTSLALPGGHGYLLFEPVEDSDNDAAVSASWLARQTIEISPGGRAQARIRPHPGGVSRTLKNLYQEASVPAWMRPSLPLVHVGGRLLYAAGIGMDCDNAWPREAPCVRLRWTSDAPTLKLAASPAAAL